MNEQMAVIAGLFLEFIVSISLGEHPKDDSAREVARAIFMRVDNGDYAAFADVSKLPPQTAISLLYGYLGVGDYDPRQFFAAKAALKTIPGGVDYLESRLRDANASGAVDVDAFIVLSLMADNKAAAAVSPYLFDTTNFPAQDDIQSIFTSRYALEALGNMKLADAPTGGDPVLYKFNDHVAWQRWAIEHHFVPEDWKSRVGIDPSETSSKWKVSEKLTANWWAGQVGRHKAQGILQHQPEWRHRHQKRRSRQGKVSPELI